MCTLDDDNAKMMQSSIFFVDVENLVLDAFDLGHCHCRYLHVSTPYLTLTTHIITIINKCAQTRT